MLFVLVYHIKENVRFGMVMTSRRWYWVGVGVAQFGETNTHESSRLGA
jgi:hypothetical protein